MVKGHHNYAYEIMVKGHHKSPLITWRCTDTLALNGPSSSQVEGLNSSFFLHLLFQALDNRHSR